MTSLQPLRPTSAGAAPAANRATVGYKELWGKAIRRARVHNWSVVFCCGESGYWTTRHDPWQFIYNLRSWEDGYWTPDSDNGYMRDEIGLTTWGGEIVKDMLNAGEITPHEQNTKRIKSCVQAALTVSYTPYYRQTGRYKLSAAMARTHGANLLMEKNPEIQCVLGGFECGNDVEAQASANALAAYQACSEMAPAKYGWSQCIDGHGDIRGVYHGEDGQLCLKILKEEVGGYRGSEVLRLRIDAGGCPPILVGHVHSEWTVNQKDLNRWNQWMQAGFWAAIHDTEIREILCGTARLRADIAPTPEWIEYIAEHLLATPDSAPGLWGNHSVSTWRKGLDVMLMSFRSAQQPLGIKPKPYVHLETSKKNRLNTAVCRYGSTRQRKEWARIESDARMVGP